MPNISGASLTQIQERLRDTPAYHPFDADTFCDWAMEAGDIVTVHRGEESYQSPVHSSHLVWRGKQNMELNASGTKERDAIARVSKQKYARGGYGMRQQKSLYHEFYSEDGYLHSYVEMSESRLVTHFDSELSDVHSQITETAEEIRSDVYAAQSSLYSYVDQTATYIRSEVANAESRMGSAIMQTASGIRSDVWASESRIYTTIEQTASNIRSEVVSAESRIGSSIEQTASGIRSDVYAANSRVYSYVDQTASRIDQTVSEQRNDLTELKGRVIVEAGKASLVAEITDDRKIYYYRSMTDFPEVGDPNVICLDTSSGKYYEWVTAQHAYVETEPNKVINAGNITTAINEAGESEAHIDANKVYIGNQKSTTVINGKLTANDVTAEFIAGRLATLSSLQVNGISSDGSVSFTGTTTLSGTVQIQGSDGNTRNLATGIRTLYKASESEGVVTLQYIDFNGETHDVTFNKAVATISGSWSNGTLTVSKDPNGSATYTAAIDSVLADGQVTYANKILTVPVTVMVRPNGGSQAGTGYSGTLSVGASLAYDAGQNAVTINKGSWSSGTISFTKSAGTASTKTVQLTAAATTWSGNTGSRVIWDGTAADAQHGVSTGYTVSVDASARYTAGETAGKNAVTINKGSWSSGQVQFTKSAGTASTKGVKVGLTGSWSGNSYSYTIKDYYDNSSGVSTGYTGTIDASARYTAGETAGKNAVTITKGSWSGGQVTFSKSTGTASNSGVKVSLGGSWSGNSYSYTIYDSWSGSAASTGYTGTIDASARYTAGQNAVTIDKGSWSSGTISFTKSAGTASTKSVQLTAAATTWSGATGSRVIWDGTAADAQHGVSTGYTVSVDASSKLETRSVTTNGTYTPTSGKIGISSIVVNVPTAESGWQQYYDASSLWTSFWYASYSDSGRGFSSGYHYALIPQRTYSTAETNWRAWFCWETVLDTNGYVMQAKGSDPHNLSLSVDMKWTGDVSGYTSMGSFSASELARTYVRVMAKCGSHTIKRYWTIN